MRADRLVSLVLLLRRRERMTAGQLAAELEVSVRTVLRDIDALSTAGVPVYAERGRHGGFALLPGFRTELTGLTADEALALLTAVSHRSGPAFGLGTSLSSAALKVVDALPEGRRADLDDAAQRLLLEPESDLLSRPGSAERTVPGVLEAVRHGVLAGRRLRIRYAAAGTEPDHRTIDPIGLVMVRGRTYLLATRAGEDRTYRVSRMLAAEVLDEAAERPDRVDLDRVWAERSAAFLAEGRLPVRLRIEAGRREELLETVRGVRAEDADEAEGWVRLEVLFEDLRHAVWAIWQLGTAVDVQEPEALRLALRRRAETILERYRP